MAVPAYGLGLKSLGGVRFVLVVCLVGRALGEFGVELCSGDFLVSSVSQNPKPRNPETLNPKPCTLNPEPCTLKPEP